VRETHVAIKEIESHLDETEQEVVMRAEREIEQAEAGLERVHKGEVGEAERVQKHLLDVKASIRDLRDKYSLKARHAELIEFIGDAEALCRQFDDRLGLAKLGDLRKDADEALRNNRESELDSVLASVREIFWQHYGKTHACWEFQVQLLHDRAELAFDPLAYHELVRKAEAALRDKDYDGVLLYYQQACRMLPDSEKLRNRFYDAALR